MKTIMQTINPESFQDEELQEACRILQNGGLVAFPTETVYGLGGDALRPEASAKIYEAKGRPSDNPLIVHIADMKDLPKIVIEIPEAAKKEAGTAFLAGTADNDLSKEREGAGVYNGWAGYGGSTNAKSSCCKGTDPGVRRLYCGSKC